MHNKASMVLILLGLALLSWSCADRSARSDNPRPDTLQAKSSTRVPIDIPAFDGVRAFRLLTRQTDFGPRAPNTVGHQRCLEFLHGQLTALADAVNLQSFTHRGADGVEYRLTNIIASFQLPAADRILLSAHWDTRPWADQEQDERKRREPILGANDGASGVAVLLEIAHHLKTSPPPIGVDIVLFDGEDLGKTGNPESFSAGSKYFAAHKPAGFRPRFGINIDMVGDRVLELRREVHSDRYARHVMDLMYSTARLLGFPQFINEPGHEVFDDHIPLNNVGIPTANLIDFEYPNRSTNYWHTLEDTPDKCSPESLAAVGQVLLHIIYTGAKQ
jgi:hypothetical protein